MHCAASRLVAALLLIVAAPMSRLAADGPGDNDSSRVRPVPPPGIEVPAADRAEIESGLAELQAAIARIDPATGTDLVADVRIWEKAARWALVYDEIFSPGDIAAAKEAVRIGLARAAELEAGTASWTEATGLVVRGYVSRIDGSVQPYGLVMPESWSRRSAARWRVDLWFHGRGEKSSELAFMTERSRNRGTFTPRDTIVLHPYGRYSNAFKFAGEIDVLEALDTVKRNYRVDEDRVASRGFSMGGAAAWQFAVHYPDLFFAANPGAGFSETPDFLRTFQGETLDPPDFERTLWHLYDCTDWARNLYHCPTVAYSGEDDRQKQAADIMEVALEREGIDLVHIVGAGMGHRYDDASREEVDRRLDALAIRGRERVPSSVRFDTWTLRYPKLHWVKVEGMEEHWKRASVTADVVPLRRLGRGRDDAARWSTFGDIGIRLRLENVAALTLEFSSGDAPFDIARPVVIAIDGATDVIEAPRPRSDRSWRTTLVMGPGGWRIGEPAAGLRKRPGLQGPVDDAFLDTFVFVRPTGTARNAAVHEWALAELDRAVREWRRQFRGDARVLDDTEVTDEILASANVVLWGDPGSNRLLARIADDLPLTWTDAEVRVGGASFDAAHHAPILVWPNPLAPERYVVLGSGVTYREYDYLNNARQVPKLPDWAIIDIRVPAGPRWPGGIAAAGFFDESWRPR